MTDHELLESINNKLDYIINYINQRLTPDEDMKQFIINVIANGLRV